MTRQSHTRQILAVAAMAVLATSATSHAVWIGTTNGVTQDAAHSYLTTSNWASGTIDNILPSGQPDVTGAVSLYFSADHATSSTGLQIYWNNLTGFPNFSLLGGGTYDAAGNNVGTAAARTLTLNGDLVFQPTATGGGLSLVIGGTGTSALNIDLGSGSRTFWAGTNATGRTIQASNTVISNGSLIKAGAGNMNLGAVNTYSGSTTVNAGTLTVGGGSILNTSNILVNASGASAGLTLNSLANGTNNRLGDTTPIVLASTGSAATLMISANSANRDATENIGTVTAQTGRVVYKQGMDNGSTLANLFIRTDADSLTRQNGSVAHFVNVRTTAETTGFVNPSIGVRRTGGSYDAGNQVFFDTAPAIAGYTSGTGSQLPIVKGVIGTDATSGSSAMNTLMTYNATEGLRALRIQTDITGATSEYVSTLGAAGTNDNVRITAGETLSSSKTINALVATATPTIAANTTLTIQSGMILGNAITGSSRTTSVLDFGAAEGFLVRTSGSAATVSAAITGSGGFTTAAGGSGSSTTFSGVNTYTGRTTIVEGTGIFTHNGTSQVNVSVPDTGTVLVHPGATVQFGENNTAVVKTEEVVGGLAGTGNVRLGNISGATEANRGKLVVGGSLSDGDTGEITLAGAGTIAPGMIDGNPVGTLNVTTDAAASVAIPLRLKNGTLNIDVASLSSNDLINVTGNTFVENGGTLAIDMDFGAYTPTVGDKWFILVAGGSAGVNTVSNSNAGVLFDTITSSLSGATFTAQIDDYGAGDNNAISVTLTAVPEPASLSLLALGAMGLIRRRRAS